MSNRKIAILGWGSLVWCPRELALASKWHADGPCLPVEFARSSGGSRVTLVIMPRGYKLAPSRVYWAESALVDREEVRDNLWEREGRPKQRFIHYAELAHDGVGFWGPNYKGGGPDNEVGQMIVDWLRSSDYGLEVAIWTGIPPEGFDHSDPERLSADVVSWLSELKRKGEECVRAAREYVEFAPPIIDTPVRSAIEQALSWAKRELPESLLYGPSVGPACPETSGGSARS